MAGRIGAFSGKLLRVLLHSPLQPSTLHSAAAAVSPAVPNLSLYGKENCFSVCSKAPDLSAVFFQGHSSWVSFKPALQFSLQIDNADGKQI